MTRPLLLIGDSPASGTGLGRILGDLAIRIHEHMSDVYRIATLGCGSPGSRQFPFQQYNIEGMSDWVIPTLPQVWEDFAGNEKGIILFIWDPSRLGWFSQPVQSEYLRNRLVLRQFLLKPPFERWLYCPVDASGPNDRLTFPLMKTLGGFDRLIAYGQFGEAVIRRTISDEESDKRHLTWLPHGVDTSKFFQSTRKSCRKMFLEITGAQPIFGTSTPIAHDEVLVSVVATNQARKEWPLAIEAFALLAQKRKARLWIHTDALERIWSLPCLLIDYNIVENTLISLDVLPDDKLAQAYSACDVMLGPGPEGFGLPLAEALACRTPVVVGSYAGQADFVPTHMQVVPVAFRYDGMWASKRPVFNAQDWADKAEELIRERSALYIDPMYHWDNLWKEKWEPYLREAAINL